MINVGIIDIIFLVIYFLCTITMLVTTIWFVNRKKKLDREFMRTFEKIVKENIKD